MLNAARPIDRVEKARGPRAVWPPWWGHEGGKVRPVGPVVRANLDAGSAASQLIAALRALGVRAVPMATGLDDTSSDAAMATLLAEAVPESSRARGGDPGLDAPRPDPRFGISEGLFAACDVCATCDASSADPACASVALWGSYVMTVRDVAELGAGFIRRSKGCDLYFTSVFPRQAVPAPAAMRAAVEADGYAALVNATAYILACRLAGVKVALTPFNEGGGGNTAISQAEIDGGATVTDPHTGTVPVSDFIAARPSWMAGLWVPTTLGWDPFYWDTTDPTWNTNTSGAATESQYQQFALHLWPTSEEEMAGVDPAVVGGTPYARECARRKGLGLSTYASVIGDWLVLLHAALQSVFGDDGIYEVLDRIDLGNEMDGVHQVTAEAGALDLSWSAHAAGRHMACVAAPLRLALPELRFRASELLYRALAECDADDPMEDSASWLREVLSSGMTATLTEWAWFQAQVFDWRKHWVTPFTPIVRGGGTWPEECLDWYRMCAAEGEFWPPEPTRTDAGFLGFEAPELVHEVGFHWFAMQDSTERGDPAQWKYRDQAALADYCAYFAAEVVDALAADGFTLTISVGSFSFPAGYANVYSALRSAAFYDGATPVLQAGLLVRLTATLFACGVERIAWFTHDVGPAEMSANDTFVAWTEPSTTNSLRNDLFGVGTYNGVAYPTDARRFATEGAWRRPAWYALRRFIGIASYVATGAAELASTDSGIDGFMAIRFELSPRVDLGGVGLHATYRYAWLLWVDQYAPGPCLPGAPSLTMVDVSLGTNARLTYAILSPIPDVVPSVATGADLDDVGYCGVDEVDWEFEGWDAALWGLSGRSVGVGDSVGTLRVTVANRTTLGGVDYPAAPLLLFTNGADIEVAG